VNPDLKKAAGGIAALFVVFCVAFLFNSLLDRSADDNIIISNENELYSQTLEETESVSEVDYSIERDSDFETEELSQNKSETDDFNGYLKYKRDNGDVYDGGWKNGKYNGKGVLNRKTGEIYDGQWIDGAFDSGKITFKINNFGGTKSVDIVSDKNWNGNGNYSLITEDGSIYDGQWFDGKKNGDGVLYSGPKKNSPAKIQTGIWENDIMIDGTETTLYLDGLHTYIVQVKNGFRNGKGILYDEKGNIKQEEQWLDDEPLGE